MDEHTSHELAYKKGYEDGIRKWIPVTERFPENGTAVLAFTVDRKVTISLCVELRVDRYQDITHWMPLPSPPSTEVSE